MAGNGAEALGVDTELLGISNRAVGPGTWLEPLGSLLPVLEHS